MPDDPIQDVVSKADAEQPRSYVIKGQEGDEMMGLVTIAPDKIGDVLDFALTPVVIVSPDQPPRIEGFLASPRTQLDIRPRESEPPHHHIGKPPREEDRVDVTSFQDEKPQSVPTGLDRETVREGSESDA